MTTAFVEAVRLHLEAKDDDPAPPQNPLLPELTPFGSPRPQGD